MRVELIALIAAIVLFALVIPSLMIFLTVRRIKRKAPLGDIVFDCLIIFLYLLVLIWAMRPVELKMGSSGHPKQNTGVPALPR